MAEVLELDEKRRVVFPDCFSPGDLFVERRISEDEVVFKKVSESEIPFAKVIEVDGYDDPGST